MVDFMRERHERGADAWVVQHVQAGARAAALVERGREVFGREPLWVAEIGPVIGIYVGPGLLGFGSIAPELLAAP
jgi:fatty acid-binding protein DegV